MSLDPAISSCVRPALQSVYGPQTGGLLYGTWFTGNGVTFAQINTAGDWDFSCSFHPSSSNGLLQTIASDHAGTDTKSRIAFNNSADGLFIQFNDDTIFNVGGNVIMDAKNSLTVSRRGDDIDVVLNGVADSISGASGKNMILSSLGLKITAATSLTDFVGVIRDASFTFNGTTTSFVGENKTDAAWVDNDSSNDATVGAAAQNVQSPDDGETWNPVYFTAGANNAAFAPLVEDYLVINGGGEDPEGLDYMHDGTCAYFDGYFFYAFNGNTAVSEGVDGQKNYVKKAATPGGLAAATAVSEFGDPAYSEVAAHQHAGMLEWQPILWTAGGRLYCLWSSLTGDDSTGTAPDWGRRGGNYICLSYKTSHDAKWVNAYLEFDASNNVTLDTVVGSAPSGTERLMNIDGGTYGLFSVNSADIDSDGNYRIGVVACELDASGWVGGDYVADDGVDRRNVAVVVTVAGVVSVLGPHELDGALEADENWEASYYDNSDGEARVVSRYPMTAARPSSTFPRGASLVMGDLTEGATPLGLEGTITRPAAITAPGGRKWGVWNDAPLYDPASLTASQRVQYRSGLALYPIQGDEWLPGAGLSPTPGAPYRYYPTTTFHGNDLLVAYTSNEGPTWNSRKEMRVAVVRDLGGVSAGTRLVQTRAALHSSGSSTADGDNLVLVSNGSASLETPGKTWSVAFNASLSEEVGAGEAVYLAVVGSYFSNVAIVALPDGSGGTKIVARTRLVSGNSAVDGDLEDVELLAEWADVTTELPFSVSYADGRVTVAQGATSSTPTPVVRNRFYFGFGIAGNAANPTANGVTTTIPLDSIVQTTTDAATPTPLDWNAEWYLTGVSFHGGTTPDYRAVHTFTQAMKAEGIWDKIAVMYLYHSQDIGAYQIDLKTKATVGSIDGSVSVLNEGYAAPAGGRHDIQRTPSELGLTYNDCGMFSALVEDYSSSTERYLQGCGNSGGSIRLLGFVNETTHELNMNFGGVSGAAIAGVVPENDQRGVILGSRLGNDMRSLKYTDAAGVEEIATGTASATDALPSIDLVTMGWRNNAAISSSSSNIALSGFTQGLTPSEQDTLAEALHSLANALGAGLP